MKKTSRIASLLMAVVMMLSLTACWEKEMDFLINGWDEGKEPTTVEDTQDTEATVDSPDASQDSGSSEGTPSGNKPSSSGQSNKPSSNSSGSSSGSSGSSSSKPSGNSGSSSTPPAQQTTYTAAEALELYKSAANPIKVNSGITVTRTREVYTQVGESNLSGLSGTIISAAFGPKDDTDKKVLSTKSDIIDGFVVEKQSYVCNLSASDIKSATVTQSGNNKIVTIYVKDDTSGQNYSNKAVSATAVADLATTFSSGLSMSCKDVRIKATIDANGRLINLNTYMPCYFTKGSEKFGAAIEQWWTITY